MSPAAATTPDGVDIVFLVDVSGSMADGARIQSLNVAMEEAVPTWRRPTSGNGSGQIRLRVAVFGSTAEWAVPDPVPAGSFWWPNLTAEPGALTELGQGLDLLTRALPDVPSGRPPAVVLVSDGMPTDVTRPTYADALAAFDQHPVGGRTVRTAIAVGAHAHRPTLESFVAPAGGTVVEGTDPVRLAAAARAVIDEVLRTEATSDDEGEHRE